MKYVVRIVWAVAVLSVLAPATELRAQRSTDIESPALPTPHEGVLLLKNGNVLTGRITWSGDHYFVDRGGLQMGVRAAEVVAAADDLDDAYRQQRDKLARDDLAGHQTLAQWCLRHDLLGYAASELAECVALYPRNQRTDSLMRQLQSAVRISQSQSNVDTNTDDIDNAGDVPRKNPKDSADAAFGAERTQDDPSDGLSAQVKGSFVTRIQPLLINQCAAGGCHGGANSAELQFHRFDPRKTPSRVYTERNLAAALRFVDGERPEASRLLVAPSAAHGSAKTPIFAGRTLGHQAELAAWIRLVARDGKRARRGDNAPQLGTTAQRQATAGTSAVSRAAYEERTDAVPIANPHDPDVFNRRYFPEGRPPNSDSENDEVAGPVAGPVAGQDTNRDADRDAGAKTTPQADRAADSPNSNRPQSRIRPNPRPYSRTNPRTVPTPHRQPLNGPQTAAGRRSLGEDDIPRAQSVEEGQVAAEQPR
ncbi:MAG: hypothetical protein WD875_02580 [Pirellulales bacterium]